MNQAKTQQAQVPGSSGSHIRKPSVPADVVSYLRSEKGMTLQQIAKLTGTTESFISRVAHGGRNFTLEHLYKIEAYLKEPLSLLLLRAMPREALPEELQPLYDQAVDLLKALGESRFPFSVPRSPAAKTSESGKRKQVGRTSRLVKAS